MRDLFVNGCSYATGWHGGNQALPTVTSKDVITDTLSWVQMFANHNNVQNCWNHSMVAKPIEMMYEDTIGFCKQYYNKYGTFENLFVINELTDPNYRKFDPVTLKGIVTDKKFDEEYKVVPIVFRSEQSLLDGEVSPWKSIFVKIKKNVDYLAEDQFGEQIDMREILKGELARHKHEKDFQHEQSKANTFRHLELTREVLESVSDFLISENIPHLLFWIGGRQEGFKKLLDKYYTKLIKHHRLIPACTFTGIDFGLKHSVEPIGVHPDHFGHKAVADFLNDYVHTYNLTAKPQLDFL